MSSSNRFRGIGMLSAFAALLTASGSLFRMSGFGGGLSELIRGHYHQGFGGHAITRVGHSGHGKRDHYGTGRGNEGNITHSIYGRPRWGRKLNGCI